MVFRPLFLLANTICFCFIVGWIKILKGIIIYRTLVLNRVARISATAWGFLGAWATRRFWNTKLTKIKHKNPRYQAKFFKFSATKMIGLKDLGHDPQHHSIVENHVIYISRSRRKKFDWIKNGQARTLFCNKIDHLNLIKALHII